MGCVNRIALCETHEDLVCSTWLSKARRGHSVSTVEATPNFVLCSAGSCRGFLVAPSFEEWSRSVKIWGLEQ